MIVNNAHRIISHLKAGVIGAVGSFYNLKLFFIAMNLCFCLCLQSKTFAATNLCVFYRILFRKCQLLLFVVTIIQLIDKFIYQRDCHSLKYTKQLWKN